MPTPPEQGDTVEPLVYIIIVNWNGKQVTLECLQSLRALTYPRAKTLVIDNASADGSVAAFQQSYPEVTTLVMDENLRFAGGNNAGIRHALVHGADMLLLLNNDTVVAPDFLTHLVSRLRSDARIGMVAPKIYYHDEPQRIWFAGGVISMWKGVMRHEGIREIDKGQHDRPHAIDYATGCCILVKREVIERVGMLDESFFIYTEDADWSMRVRRSGYTIVYEPKATVWHKLSVTTGGHLSWFKMKNKFIGNLRFFGRYAAWYQWPVFPWMNLVANGVAALRYFWTTRKD